MSRKKTHNRQHRKPNNKKPITDTKNKTKFLSKLSYIYSIILTVITIYSWVPKISVEPQVMYFDGKHETFQIIIKNDSFIPINDITTIIDLKELEIDENKFSNTIQKFIDNKKVLFSNKPTTIHFRVFKIGMRPINEIKKSNLEFNISYKLPLMPISFNENYSFTAIKNSEDSIKWLPK